MLVIVGFYGAYTVTRDLHSTSGGLHHALHNAFILIRLEKSVDAFHEQALQHMFISDRGFIEFWNSFYGTAHFVMVIFVLVVLYWRYPARYRRARDTLALTTALALIGFAVFPVAPPRLLPASYHFVDTLSRYAGVWNFSHGPVAHLSNQYAAMPSLHTAWSSWCALMVIPLIRPWWGKLLVVAYPLSTMFCVVVTANHYFVDEAGGLLTLYVAFAITGLLSRRAARRSDPLLA